MIIEVNNFSLKHLQQVMAILVVHGKNIKTLYIEKCNYALKTLGLNQSALVTWISYIPELEYVNFTCVEYGNIQNFNNFEQSIIYLPKLERVRFPPYAFASVLHRLPKSSLESLLLANANPLPNIREIFERHHETLSELQFFCCFPYTDPTIFHQLQLEIFHIHAPEPNISQQFLIEVLSHQKKITSLCLGDIGSNERIFVSENLFRTICELKELKKLVIGKILNNLKYFHSLLSLIFSNQW